MTMRRGFTLVEMIVVILIMMLVMATLLPALAMMQKKADLYAANNVINVVHNVQRSYAMQFGHTGAIYGYTIRADNSTAPGIQPFVIWDGEIKPMSGVDVGKQLFWNSNRFVDITDNLRAVRDDAPAGVSPSTSGAGGARLWDSSVNANRDLNIAFVPRAGFATTSYSGPGVNINPSNDDPTALGALGVLGTEREVSFRLRSNRTGFRDHFVVRISKTGIISFYAP